ncbi:SDR family oxidoreductase [Psychroserpens sp. NJDZ02]|uniref:SDR family oxidoreductase n=1 Tax=Psychroserpens sp. NJDZ02 TaxID=2570561 RepID=UPI0010A86CC4|nr:SDR family oxidoreductase [Psychroserpens sp. NJDZ02]QCE41160.1 SDR family oxidoreductase [Psychroserpens sp. NJDZ02]
MIINKKVLVTGGAGFIGSNLVDQLLKNNNIVICLDNLSTGHKRNIKDNLANPNFKFIKGDIRDLETCVLASKDVDFILHQAALGSVPRSIKNPVASSEVNVLGFVNILWSAVTNKVKRVVYAASSSTYGDNIELPKVEDNTGDPLSPYAVTKLVNELYAKIFAKTYNIETVGLRYFNVFGPKQDPNGDYAAVIPKFINLIKEGHSPIVNGDGLHSRDFTYIDNVVQANQLAATTTNLESLNKVYNIACGRGTNLNQLIEVIKSEIKEKGINTTMIKTIYGPERVGDIRHSLASIDRAKMLLGYNPTITFDEGIKLTIKSFFN